MIEIYNGDIYDIGQTVNGISRFLFYNDKWHYYSETITKEYEYSQIELTMLIQLDKVKGFDEVNFLGNIFSYI